MIPANGEFYAHFKNTHGNWPTVAKKVIAWDDQGRPMVLGAKGLVSADSIDNLMLDVVREALAPVQQPLPTVPESPTPAPQSRVPFGSYIDPELQKELRVVCAAEDLEIRDALDEALRLWLNVKSMPRA